MFNPVIFLGGLVHNLFHINHCIDDVIDNILGQLLLMLKNEVQHFSPFFGHPLMTSNMPPNDYVVIVCSFPIELYDISFNTIWILSWFFSFNLTSTIYYFISFEICHDFFELIEVCCGSFDLIWALSRFFWLNLTSVMGHFI